MKLIKKIKNFFLSLFKTESYYVNSAGTLPPPLSTEEEKEAIEGLISSDSDYVQKCRNNLIAHNLRLVVFISKKFETTGIKHSCRFVVY